MTILNLDQMYNLQAGGKQTAKEIIDGACTIIGVIAVFNPAALPAGAFCAGWFFAEWINGG